MANVSEKTINGILDTMKSLIEKAQILQGPPSSSGNLATQTNAEVLQDLETRVGAGAVDYVPTPPGVGDPAAGMGGVQKAQDDDEDEDEAEEEEGEEEDEDEEDEDDEDEKKKKGKKGKKAEKGRGMKDYDKAAKEEKSQRMVKKSETETPIRTKDREKEKDKILEKTCMKSSPQQYDYDYEEVLPVDNVILELTRSVDSALKSLATRVDFFMKALGAHQYEMMKSLSGLLAVTSEGLAKSFNVIQEESHTPDRGPKSAFTPDVQKSQQEQQQANYNKGDIIDLMCKSIERGNTCVRPEDITLLETSGTVRKEVKDELGIA